MILFDVRSELAAIQIVSARSSTTIFHSGLIGG